MTSGKMEPERLVSSRFAGLEQPLRGSAPQGEAASSAAPKTNYRADIDGLRGIAVTSVVFFHAGLFSSGFVGVDIFFVISGYLIGGIILRGTSKGAFDFAKFYARRARRILPALILVVLATCLAGFFLLDAHEYYDLGVTGTLALLGASNINFWHFQDYFAPGSELRPFLMTWSLGVEEQFYLFFPMLMIVTTRVLPARVLSVIIAISLISFAFALWWTWSAPPAAFFLLPSRTWELGIGVALAAWELKQGFGPNARMEPSRFDKRTETLAALGLALLAIAIVGFDASTPFPGFMALLPVFGAAILIRTQWSWINTHILASRPLVFVGLVSYSWYLWHWPLMSLLRIIAPGDVRPRFLFIAAIASFLLAILSWRFVETPFRRPTLPSGRVLLRYGAVLLTALMVPISIKASGGIPQRLSAQARQIEAIRTTGRSEECITQTGSELVQSPRCVFDIKGRPAVALLGDSVASSLAPGLRELAKQENLGVRIFTHSACQPFLDVEIRAKNDPGFQDTCATFKRNALQRLLTDANVKVVVLAGLWTVPEDDGTGEYYLVGDPAPTSTATQLDLFRAGVTRMIHTLVNAGKKVVLVGDTPHWKFDPLRVELGKAIFFRGTGAYLCTICVDAENGAVPRATLKRPKGAAAVLREAAEGDALYLDIFSKFCDDRECRFESAGEPLFFDWRHPSAAGARMAFKGVNLEP